jgi:hypothetical protein
MTLPNLCLGFQVSSAGSHSLRRQGIWAPTTTSDRIWRPRAAHLSGLAYLTMAVELNILNIPFLWDIYICIDMDI